MLAREGEAREIQLDGVNRQRLFLSNMKTKSTDLRKEKQKGKGMESERRLSVRLQRWWFACLRVRTSEFLPLRRLQRRTADGRRHGGHARLGAD